MKRIFLILICSLLYIQSNSQIQARNDTFYLRSDTAANFKLDVKNNDSSGTKLHIYYFFKKGANASKFKIERSADSAYIILTDTISATSYNGEFRYFCRDSVGNLDTADVFFSKIALSPEVRPGETNNDGLVNHFDLFPIGLNFGKSGSPRHSDDTNIVFIPKRVGNWFFQLGGINAKFADINGNGKVESRDFDQLKFNIGNVSGTYKPFLSPTSATTLLDVISDDTVAAKSDTLRLRIRLNTSAKPLAYGLGYTINVQKHDKITQQDSFYPNYKFIRSNAWLKGSKPELFIEDAITRPNERNIAYCRTDHSNDTMSGDAGIVEIVVTEILLGLYKESDIALIKINLSDVALIDNNYSLIPVKPVSKTIYLKKSKSSIAQSSSPRIQIYPTLIANELIIEKAGIKIESYSIYNSVGQLIQTGDLIHQRTSIETIQWHSGIYYLKLDNSSESIKIQKR